MFFKVNNYELLNVTHIKLFYFGFFTIGYAQPEYYKVNVGIGL